LVSVTGTRLGQEAAGVKWIAPIAAGFQVISE
jgi:hypothetical protein